MNDSDCMSLEVEEVDHERLVLLLFHFEPLTSQVQHTKEKDLWNWDLAGKERLDVEKNEEKEVNV